MMEENLFVFVEYSLVKHTTSRFSVRKNVTKEKRKKKKKKRKRVAPEWTDMSGPSPARFSEVPSTTSC